MGGDKKCFKCWQVKPLYQFYRLKSMADGHAGKCKECTKADARRHYFECMLDHGWCVKERDRNRVRMMAKRRTLGIRERRASTPETVRATKRKWAIRNPQKIAAQRKAAYAVSRGMIQKAVECQRCSKGVKLQMHHRDYSKPLDVLWLCTACHGIEHRKPIPQAA